MAEPVAKLENFKVNPASVKAQRLNHDVLEVSDYGLGKASSGNFDKSVVVSGSTVPDKNGRVEQVKMTGDAFGLGELKEANIKQIQIGDNTFELSKPIKIAVLPSGVVPDKDLGDIETLVQKGKVHSGGYKVLGKHFGGDDITLKEVPTQPAKDPVDGRMQKALEQAGKPAANFQSEHNLTPRQKAMREAMRE